MNLIRILSILVLVAFSVAQSHDESKMQVLTMSNNLQFTNDTRQNVSDEMLKSFVSYANTASAFYGDDVQKNAKYIKLRMDQVYGGQNYNFYIYIQTQDVPANTRIWVFVQRIYAGLSDINKINPKWSYFFQKNIGTDMIKDYTYIQKDKVGAETYKDGLYDYMKSTINQYQVDDVCTCSPQSIIDIGNNLQFRTNTKWSVICDSKGITVALLQNYEKRWASLKVKQCYYLMYTF